MTINIDNHMVRTWDHNKNKYLHHLHCCMAKNRARRLLRPTKEKVGCPLLTNLYTQTKRNSSIFVIYIYNTLRLLMHFGSSSSKIEEYLYPTQKTSFFSQVLLESIHIKRILIYLYWVNRVLPLGVPQVGWLSLWAW